MGHPRGLRRPHRTAKSARIQRIRTDGASSARSARPTGARRLVARTGGATVVRSQKCPRSEERQLIGANECAIRARGRIAQYLTPEELQRGKRILVVVLVEERASRGCNLL